MGSDNLYTDENNIFVDNIVDLIKQKIEKRIKTIHFNIQNNEIIIRNINNLKSKRTKEIIQLIKYEINVYMPLNLQNYVIKYKKIINTKGIGAIQGILFPKKYVSICNLISENLKIKKKYLHINFDILQKLMDLNVVDLQQSGDDKVTIIENRQEDLVINTVFNKKIIESYVIDKFNSQSSINKFTPKNTYYYGINDNFIKSFQIQKLDIKNKLIFNNNEEVLDVTLTYLPAWGMII